MIRINLYCSRCCKEVTTWETNASGDYRCPYCHALLNTEAVDDSRRSQKIYGNCVLCLFATILGTMVVLFILTGDAFQSLEGGIKGFTYGLPAAFLGGLIAFFLTRKRPAHANKDGDDSQPRP